MPLIYLQGGPYHHDMLMVDQLRPSFKLPWSHNSLPSIKETNHAEKVLTYVEYIIVGKKKAGTPVYQYYDKKSVRDDPSLAVLEELGMVLDYLDYLESTISAKRKG